MTLHLSAQDITGKWYGVLSIQGTQLHLVFNVNRTGETYSATMQSPDQSEATINASSFMFENQVMALKIAPLKIEYLGALGQNGIIVGHFKQNGMSFPMNLSREELQAAKPIRPQEPVKPYSYHSEDITFENKKAGIKLAGTLTLPKQEGNCPAVILISGSGPQNRDEELLGHKPFLVLSDYLTKNGIAVLRFDDRGTAASTGNFKTATTVDFSTDVEAGIEFLRSRKEIDKKKIGLIGHSEGGLIAPMVASGSKNVAFIVLLAGPGLPGDQLLLMQQEAIGKASGTSDEKLAVNYKINKDAFDMVRQAKDPEKLKTDLTVYLKQSLKDHPEFEKPEGMSDQYFVMLQVSQITSPWMLYYIKYDPAIALEKTKCPVLALNGEKDLQVPSKENLEAVKNALTKGGNTRSTIKELPGLNHLFQECKTGSPDEYSETEQTLSPGAMTEILNWIRTCTQ